MSSSTASKRQRNNAGTAGERSSDAPSPQLMALFTVRLQEHADQMSTSLRENLKKHTDQIATLVRETEARILSSLTGRLDLIEGEVKKTGERVLCLEREVVDLRAQREQLDERVEHLQREIADMRAMRERVGSVEAKLAAQKYIASNNVFDLRVHGVPYVEGENLRTLFNQLCFNLQLTPPPRVRDIFRARKTQKSNIDPVIIVKMDNEREQIAVLRKIGAYRREAKAQLNLKFVGIDSEALIYVNEQLIRDNYLIFKEAMRLKKRKVLAAVFTRRGAVHVRCNGSESIQCIESMEELLRLSPDKGTPTATLSLHAIDDINAEVSEARSAALESFRS